MRAVPVREYYWRLRVGGTTSSGVDDVGITDTWDRLRDDPMSVLVDVRTRAEWAFVGLPDLGQLGKRPILIEWQTFPDNREDAEFAQRLGGALTEAGATPAAEIFFICRSGSRSRRAALAMVAAGYSRCRNVADGFEGPLDTEHHRGRIAGWKAAGLPWAQG